MKKRRSRSEEVRQEDDRRVAMLAAIRQQLELAMALYDRASGSCRLFNRQKHAISQSLTLMRRVASLDDMPDVQAAALAGMDAWHLGRSRRYRDAIQRIVDRLGEPCDCASPDAVISLLGDVESIAFEALE